MINGSSKSLIYSIILLLFCSATHSQSFPVVINEVMSSNLNTIADEDGDYEDWIELHNRGDEPVNLEGWGLSDDDFTPYKWVFPDVTIHPDEYLIIWASGKDRTEGELHTNFSISSDGEPILFTHPEQGVVQFVPAVPIPGQVSYGLNPNQSGFFYYSQPTPGAPNITKAYSQLLNAEPIFSHTGGFYTEPFELTISTDIPGAKIYYTLDGSEPDPDNLEGTTYQYKNSYPHGELLTREVKTYLYEEPLYIYDRSEEPYELAAINTRYHTTFTPTEATLKGTPLRVAIRKEGVLIPNSSTQTYFVTPNGRNRFNLPVLSIVTDERNLFDYEKGIYIAGEKSVNWFNSNPDASWHWSVPANYHQRGREWERPASIEVFYNPKERFNQNIGIRIHGGATRSLQMKSLRLYPRNAYSTSNFSLDFPFFPNLKAQGDSNKKIESFERLILRNSGNDFSRTLFRDALMQDLVKHLPISTQAYQPTVHFINGEFWGIINIRERYDADYLSSHFNIKKEDIAILEAWISQDTGPAQDRQQFSAIRNYAENHNMNEQSHIQWVENHIDIDNLLHYYAVQIYFNNTDWPQNNVKYWRKRTSTNNINTPPGHDGKWRWMLYDTDFGMGHTGNYTNNSLLRVLQESTNDHATRVFKAIMKNDSIRSRFINTIADHLNSTFLPDRVITKVDEFNSRIHDARFDHFLRWNSGDDKGDVIKEFADKRPGYLRNFVMEQFDVEDPISIELNRIGNGIISINTLIVDKKLPGISDEYNLYPWFGKYFKDVPIILKAIDQPGYSFSHWDGVPESLKSKRKIEIIPESDISITAIFEEAPLIETIHHWHFNHLENEIFYQIKSDNSKTEKHGIITYPGEGNGYMDIVKDGTAINLREETDTGNALRVRNPSKDRELIFQLPTTAYEDVTFSYATSRTSNGAEFQDIYYRTTEDGEWNLIKERNLIIESYYRISVDFTDINEVNNNPEFAVKIRFTGEKAMNSSGNNRFDNIMLEGFPVNQEENKEPPTNITKNLSLTNELNIYPNPASEYIYIESENEIQEIHIKCLNGIILVKKYNLNQKDINFNVSRIPSGLYFVSVTTKFGITIEKISVK
ncbi:CotH kinase family protein [Natronoflexus pectinivorans]|uniref:Putative secreted protein (Por secretion system target) n=1 Tax=Natronoflexus pectinivorans TaxID=682526 RepID=A0A4R2GIW9_9BACT|nr:CotH kinase family protein [Natronoflexus pectinivorans]TCO07882.1 putative secreted protein (Por secretion system target) [Natronoflexus pectinivorans]